MRGTMSEPELNQKNEFIIEKIKERPVNKKKLLRRTVITASMAVIFGLIACFTFLVLEPVISNFLYPEEEPQMVVFPEDQEEMSPEEMLADNMQQESQTNQIPADQIQEIVSNVEIDREQIEEILSGMVLGKDNYKQLYYAMANYVDEIEKSIVTVTGVSSNLDWFNNVQESTQQSSGLLIAENGVELMILADYEPLEDAETLSVTFFNNAHIEAQLKGVDSSTNLAIISIDLVELSNVMSIEDLPIAELGTSNISTIVGTPVVAIGSPMGVSGSVGYGMVTASSILQNQPDTNYKLLQTDIMGSQKAGGILFNLNGQVLGIITNGKTGSDMKNMVTAYGISELKKRVERIINGKTVPYLGISGVDVTREAHEELNVPYGAYVTEIEMDSPSMKAGIQQGDILVSIDGRKLYSYSEYTVVLMQLDVGQAVEVVVVRQAQDEYKEMTFDIVLGER